MAYEDFTLENLEEYFGIKNQQQILFKSIKNVEASERLKGQLEDAENFPVRSEKAKSEFIVAPILIELSKRNNKFFTIYSGDTLTGSKEKGLTGECDFILAKDTKSFLLNLPILTLVEAKRHDIMIGIPQCAAQMLGAKIFNEQRGKPLDVIYGCVTTGELWKFMRLKDNTIEVDTKTYFLDDIDKILGAFQIIINYYKKVLGE